jgi:ASCH domain
MVGNMYSSLKELIVVLESREQPLDIQFLTQVCVQRSLVGHLAVFTQPYLDKILSGEKTIESRFSRSRSVPFEKVHRGDIILLKETAKPIRAIAIVTSVRCYGPLGPGEAGHLMEVYQTELRLEDDFKRTKQNSLYATLITLSDVLPINPIQVKKVDRRPWVVLAEDKESVVSNKTFEWMI